MCIRDSDNGYTLSTNGTDTHLILCNLNPLGLTGSKVETVCDHVGITLNKNSVFGDTSALSPGGIRIGTPALTSRGFREEEFIKVGNLIHKCIQLSLEIQSDCESKKLKVFKQMLETKKYQDKIEVIHNEVIKLASSFPLYN